MPVQPNILPAVQLTPFRVDGEQDTNNGVGRGISHVNQPWTLRAHQTVVQALNGSANFTTLGFDTLDYNTYKAIGGNLYSLRFTAAGGYPYSIFTVPSFGYYDIRAALPIVADSLAGTWNTLNIFVNGVQVSIGDGPQFTYLNNALSAICTISDIIQLNPGDNVQIESYIAGASNWTSSGDKLTRVSIRYLGLT